MANHVELTFLGTSGMIPDAERNHPAFLISYKAENILVDCGEGTQVQFRKAKLNPCKVTRILITHWHGDHTFGLPGFLRTLSTSGYNKTLFIYGPKGFKKHMNEMFKAFGGITEYKINVEEVSGKFLETEDFYVEAEQMVHVQPCNAYNFVLKGKIRIDKRKLKKYRIGHGPHLKHVRHGKDIVYKGKKYRAKNFTFGEKEKKISFVLDTSLNARIVPFVRNADLLVSEASFSHELEDKAREYRHLTSRQAAQNAKDGKVKKLILTHLSQRYSKNPEKILKEAKKIYTNTSVAKDLDVVSV